MTPGTDERPQMSVEEFEELARVAPETVTLELINGKLEVKPVPDGDHGEIIMWLLRQCMMRTRPVSRTGPAHRHVPEGVHQARRGPGTRRLLRRAGRVGVPRRRPDDHRGHVRRPRHRTPRPPREAARLRLCRHPPSTSSSTGTTTPWSSTAPRRTASTRTAARTTTAPRSVSPPPSPSPWQPRS